MVQVVNKFVCKFRRQLDFNIISKEEAIKRIKQKLGTDFLDKIDTGKQIKIKMNIYKWRENIHFCNEEVYKGVVYFGEDIPTFIEGDTFRHIDDKYIVLSGDDVVGYECADAHEFYRRGFKASTVRLNKEDIY